MKMIFNVYLFCLAIGVIYTAFTTLIHGVVSIADIGADFHFDADHGDVDFDVGHADFDAGHADFDIGHSDFLLPMKPFTIMIFLTVFGGCGIILIRFLLPLLTLPISFVVAYIISYSAYRLIYLRLVKAQTTAKKAAAAIGVEAIVLEKIPEGGMGRISYKVDGNILSGAAKELKTHSGGFSKNQRVFIHEIKDNIYYVTDYPLIYSKMDKDYESEN